MRVGVMPMKRGPYIIPVSNLMTLNPDDYISLNGLCKLLHMSPQKAKEIFGPVLRKRGKWLLVRIGDAIRVLNEG